MVPVATVARRRLVTVARMGLEMTVLERMWKRMMKR
jgi:hypothetical protein